MPSSAWRMDVKKILETIRQLPPDFALVPVNGNKRPLGHEWQHRTFTPKSLHDSIEMGGISVKNKKGKRITVWLPAQGEPPGEYEFGGFALLNGSPVTVEGKTFYLMSVDCDGKSAVNALKKLSNSSTLPRTVAFSSGRHHRCQYLFLVPENIAPTIRTRKLTTGKGEQLEFRWKGLISILPPSVHPSTGRYRWRRNIRTTPIQEAPDWAIEVMQGKLTIRIECDSCKAKRKVTVVRTCHRGAFNHPSARQSTTCAVPEVEKAIALLDRIPPQLADDYWDWIKIGTALKTVSEELLPAWESWSRQSEKYKTGECEYKWRTFVPGTVTIGTLYYFARTSN